MVAEVVEIEASAELRVDRKFLLNRQGKDYVTYPGLVDLLHRASEGFFGIETQLVQAPNRDNGMVAICTARVLIYDPAEPDVVRRVATGIGDADPENVGRGMAPHLIRLAETRAKARAIRDAVNVAMVAAEELGPDDQQEAPRMHDVARSGAAPRPVPPRLTETISRGGQTYTRDQVVPVFLHRVQEAERLAVPLPPGLPTAQSPLEEIADYSAKLKPLLAAQAGK